MIKNQTARYPVVVLLTEHIIDEQKIELLFGTDLEPGIINDLTLGDLEKLKESVTKG